jgi:protein SCO1/2
MSLVALVSGSVLWLLVLATLWLVVARRSSAPASPSVLPSPNSPATDEVVPPITATTKTIKLSFPTRPLPDFTFPEAQGGTLSLADLKGKRWLANFVFTRCVGPCPLMTRDIADLHRRVATSAPEFLFVTFSVDSSYDTPEVLKKYAETFAADPQRWKFLSGDELAIHDYVRRGFAQFVQPNIGDSRKPGYEVAHSNRAVLVNEDGIPVGTWLMTVPEDVVKLRRVIEGRDEFPTPGPILKDQADGQNPPVNLNILPLRSQDDAPPETSSSDPAQSPPAVTTPQELSTVERNREIDAKLPGWIRALPSLNATLNALCTLLLIAGYLAIQNERRDLHRNLMISAFAVSVVFLASYLTYHETLYRWTGQRGRAFVGSDLARILYFAILIPHVILAALVPFLALRIFHHAWKQRWTNHRRLARITLPIWLFVSITGIVIYGMLYHWPWSTIQPAPIDPGSAL